MLMSESRKDTLQKRHKAIYDEFLPTLNTYTKMASEILEIQVELFRMQLAEAFPGTTIEELPRVAAICARLAPAQFSVGIESLLKQKVKPSRIIYDPIKHDFIVFGQK